jgi:hypothetical protein
VSRTARPTTTQRRRLHFLELATFGICGTHHPLLAMTTSFLQALLLLLLLLLLPLVLVR